ncbi:type IX secretion system protein PorQ [Putridiphycobacter roseus]|nr:type IX secretion system protein PorQ [Putridiphycobacter roseus]
MMNIKTNLFCLFLFVSSSVMSQIGGQSAFQFLDLNFNARSAALGGDFGAANDNDINLSVLNPASINTQMDKNVALNHAFYPAGINYGQLMIGHDFEKIGMVVMHMRYVAYGKFNRTDPAGNDLGTFTAGDYAIGAGYGKKLNERFSIGGNVNLIFSQLESYFAFGVGIDFAVMYQSEDENVIAHITARNVGVQFKGYTKSNREPLPIEVLAGVSYKLNHAPFRFSLVAHDLTDWDLSYLAPFEGPLIDPLNPDDTLADPSISFLDKTFRHLNLGVEIIPTDNFSLRIGYNFNRRQTFIIPDRISITGFSAGVGFRVKKLDFNYSIVFDSPAGSTNMLSITSNFSEWKKTKS